MRARLLMTALSALLLLAGCSGSGGSKATPTPSPTPLTAEQAKAVAAAGVLTADDLAGYSVAPAEADPTEDEEDKKLVTCLGTTTTTPLASDPGRTFSKDTTEIDSSVEIVTSADAAKAEVDALNTTKGEQCIKQLVQSAASDDGVTIRTLSTTRTPITVPGSDGAFAYSLVFEGTIEDGSTLSVQGYELGAAAGQAEVTLSVFAIGRPTITLEQATALLTTSVDRVKAAS